MNKLFNNNYLHIIIITIFLIVGLAQARSKQWKISDLHIEGNTTFTKSVLQNQMELKPTWIFGRITYSNARLRSDLETLRKFYRSQGFLNVEVSSENNVRDTSKQRIDVTITINEGPRTIVSSVRIFSRRNLVDTAINKDLKNRAGEPLLASALQSDIETIRNSLTSKGYLEVEVKHDIVIDSLKNGAGVIFKVNEGPLIRVKDISISGIKGIRLNVIMRELAFYQGDTLTIDKLRKSERQLYRTNLFSFIRIEPDFGDTSAATVTDLPDSSYSLKVIVAEADHFRFEGGAGYGTSDGFRASMQTSYSNLFKLGHSITLIGNVSQKTQYVESIYTTPWFLGLPLQFNGSVYLNRYDDYENTYYGIFRGLRLSLGQTTAMKFAYQVWINWEDVVELNIKNDTIPKIPTQSIGTNITYDNRNNLINPSQGVFNTAEFEVAGLTGKSSQFIRMTDDARFYWTLGPFLFGSSIKVGLVFPYGEMDTVPQQKQFYAGGARSVRGFTEDHLLIDASGDALSGNFLLTANIIDIRIPLFWWFQGAVFLDAGNVWESARGHSISTMAGDLRWSAGPGIRLNTPIAVVRFDVGFKLNKRPNEKVYALHFDLGQPF
jgi:outer membrane protein assembly complex protein YaeT